MNIVCVKTSQSGAVETIHGVTKNTMLFSVDAPVLRKRMNTDEEFYRVKVIFADKDRNRYPSNSDFGSLEEAEAYRANVQKIISSAEGCPMVPDGLEMVGRIRPYHLDGGEPAIAVIWTKDVPLKPDENVKVDMAELGW